VKFQFVHWIATMPGYWETPEHNALTQSSQKMKSTHLRDLLKDDARNSSLFVTGPESMVADFSRQNVNQQVLQQLVALAKKQNVSGQIKKMFAGEAINTTEGRSVLHVALRAPKGTVMKDNTGADVVPGVHEVLDAIHAFSDKFRTGQWKGHTGKSLTDVICIGIGGSYLGVEFIMEGLKTDPTAAAGATGRRIHFLANVDPIDVARAVSEFDPETTLAVVISKTFTTAETMLNARTIKDWLLATLKDPVAVSKHVVAVSTNHEATKQFGIDPNNVFGFWDWVGGRFSACSAVGVLPLALQYGFPVVQQFLDGCRTMDEHFLNNCETPEKNLPMMMGLMSLWNATYMNHECVAVLPYCQALHRFAAHVQQLTMESNGKAVTVDGTRLPMPAGEVYFGEPGTNGQHSFYQLIHQGRVIPAEFIGFCKSQKPVHLHGDAVSNHDELMSNFFAQPDALALGKDEKQLKTENTPAELIPHKKFDGNRPSTMLMAEKCDAHTIGMLLSLYENRTATEGFVWGVNSFDQWGVQLGKILATNIRKVFEKARQGFQAEERKALPSPTNKMLDIYLKNSA